MYAVCWSLQRFQQKASLQMSTLKVWQFLETQALAGAYRAACGVTRKKRGARRKPGAHCYITNLDTPRLLRIPPGGVQLVL